MKIVLLFLNYLYLPDFFVDNVSHDGDSLDLLLTSDALENIHDSVRIICESYPISVEEHFGFLRDHFQIELSQIKCLNVIFENPLDFKILL